MLNQYEGWVGTNMRIGILATGLNGPLTGIGVYIYNLIDALNRANISDIDIITINHKEMDCFPNEQIIIENPFPLISTYAWYSYIFRKIGKYNIDIIHNPAQVPTIFTKKLRYIISVMDLTPFIVPNESKHGRPLIYKLLFNETLKKANKIISISESTRNDLVEYFDIESDKIVTIPLAVNALYKHLPTEKTTIVKQKYNINYPYILYVGTLEARKNIARLIKAFYKLRKQGVSHKLIIVGKRGWKYKEIFDIIRELHLESDVIFTGYVRENDLPALYSAADVFVYPSIYEGFGLPLLEAMACGTPVITSNASSLPEVVNDAAVTVNPYDTDSLTNAIYAILSNNDLRSDLVRKGYKRAASYSWDKCASRTVQVYNDVYSEI